MEQPTTNEGLKKTYNEIYADGPENFHTFTDEDVQAEIFDTRESWSSVNVLEVGCGEGALAAAIAADGGHVMAIDYSEEAIKAAKDKHRVAANPKGTLHYCVSDIDTHGLRLGSNYDVVIASEVIEHTDNPPEFIRQLAALTSREDGEVIVTCPSFWNVRGIVWMTLRTLLDVPMTLTDLHFFTPTMIEDMAFLVGLEKISMTTMRKDVGFGDKMVMDLRRRLRLTLGDWNANKFVLEKSTAYGSLPGVVPEDIEDRIEMLLGFLMDAGTFFDGNNDLTGATLIGRFRKCPVVAST